MAGSRPDDPPWLKAAFRDNGLREIKGAKHNPRVIEMFRKAGHSEVSDDETAWCAAAVGCWLNEAGMPNSGSLMARSYTKYGIALDTDAMLPRGAIVVWPRGAPPSGHVNIVVEDNGNMLTCIGGNQSPAPGAVSISRSSKAGVISARWPADYPLPSNMDFEPQGFADQTEVKQPWWRKAKTWLSGGGFSLAGMGIYDWRVAIAIGVVGLIIFLVVWFTYLRKRLEKE